MSTHPIQIYKKKLFTVRKTPYIFKEDSNLNNIVSDKSRMQLINFNKELNFSSWNMEK